MNKRELLSGLRNFQKWRKGADIPQPDPKEVGRLLDSAISVIEKANIKVTNKILKDGNNIYT